MLFYLILFYFILFYLFYFFLWLGAAVAVPLNETDAKLCMVSDLLTDLASSPIGTAYARARG